MLGLIPFAQCVARPEENGKENWLTDHLLGVKNAIETRLKKCIDDALLIRLAGLAGTCHDLVKSHIQWQQYIKGELKKGPNHAPDGAFLFSYLGYHFLQTEQRWPQYAGAWLRLTQDIADHHGALKSLGEKNWMNNGPWDKLDLPGMTAFLKQVYPEWQLPDIAAVTLSQWAVDLYDIEKDAKDALDAGYAKTAELMEQLSAWREMTTALIAGDRFHVTPVEEKGIHKADHERHERLLDDFCRAAQKGAMAALRSDAQQQILRQMERNPMRRVYTLEMPTGYGKTITALRLATWLGEEQGYEKIIYVAPYLSILEQTSGVIETIWEESVLEHHSLATLSSGQKGAKEHAGDENEEEEKLPSGQLIMESWANPIVCTSFQQWSKAIFPGRAQDTLRRAFLHNSVVIIDEPQIFAKESWNVFLCGLEAVAKLYNLRILFLSATMPPFDYGLSKQNLPGRLAVRPVEKVERYRVKKADEPMDEQAVARYLTSYLPDEKGLAQAAILNTIADAYLVYQKLAPQAGDDGVKLLHGMMVPLHKRVEIEKIKKFSENNREKRLYVVSTQIIEAGVDLSFHHIMRALPILPSIVQAAGRVNRNFSSAIGLLTLMLFLRKGEKNTRGSIYPADLQKLTDELLQRKEVWLESELLELIKEYYHEMFVRNSYEAGKRAIKDAYEGNWPALGQQFKPFGEDYYRLPVFVPWQATKEDEAYFPKRFVELRHRLRLDSPEQIYALYEDRDYYAGMSFQERKEFMILMNHYVVNVPAKLAFSLVEKEKYLINRIPCLLNKREYDADAGLAKRAVDGFDSFI